MGVTPWVQFQQEIINCCAATQVKSLWFIICNWKAGTGTNKSNCKTVLCSTHLAVYWLFNPINRASTTIYPDQPTSHCLSHCFKTKSSKDSTFTFQIWLRIDILSVKSCHSSFRWKIRYIRCRTEMFLCKFFTYNTFSLQHVYFLVIMAL